MATFKLGDYRVSIKATKDREDRTEELLNAFSLFLRYGSYFMRENDMRTLSKEPELYSEDIFDYLCDSGFFGRTEQQDLEVRL